jgi:hypothetical protein
MLPARMRYGAETGMWKVRYCDSWSRWRSDSIWKEVLGPEKRLERRRILVGNMAAELERYKEDALDMRV